MTKCVYFDQIPEDSTWYKPFTLKKKKRLATKWYRDEALFCSEAAINIDVRPHNMQCLLINYTLLYTWPFYFQLVGYWHQQDTSDFGIYSTQNFDFELSRRYVWEGGKWVKPRELCQFTNAAASLSSPVDLILNVNYVKSCAVYMEIYG